MRVAILEGPLSHSLSVLPSIFLLFLISELGCKMYITTYIKGDVECKVCVPMFRGVIWSKSKKNFQVYHCVLHEMVKVETVNEETCGLVNT